RRTAADLSDRRSADVLERAGNRRRSDRGGSRREVYERLCPCHQTSGLLRAGLLFLMLARKLVAEGIGTMLLLAAVVGSGIMGERLCGGNVAIALLANTIATGATLVAIILALGGISGAHLNPAVTLAVAMERGIAWREA